MTLKWALPGRAELASGLEVSGWSPLPTHQPRTMLKVQRKEPGEEVSLAVSVSLPFFHRAPEKSKGGMH